MSALYSFSLSPSLVTKVKSSSEGVARPGQGHPSVCGDQHHQLTARILVG